MSPRTPRLPAALGRRTAAIAAAAVVAFTAAGCTAEAPAPSAPAGAGQPTATPLPSATPSTADVVERLRPSVVMIRTGQGAGSGVVYRENIVLTNAHVVGDATDVVVEFADGTSSPGAVLATDTVTDLAVVRTERGGLPVPEYCPELPRPGAPALAIGSPLGFEGTVSAGVVSGLNRQIPGSAAQSRALVDLIQTDAAISPGNSGGALLDATGCVIGINEAYIPPAAGAVSIGFAIPAATAVNIADQLLADGTATHPFLGVQVSRITPQIRDQLGVPAQDGALVTAVEPGGPAAAAGLQQGDVIVALAGQDVASIEDLFGALRGTTPGERAELVVQRGQEQLTLPVVVGSEG